jgi:hypothetical protein
VAPRGADHGLRGPRDEPGFVGGAKLSTQGEITHAYVSYIQSLGSQIVFIAGSRRQKRVLGILTVRACVQTSHRRVHAERLA